MVANDFPAAKVLKLKIQVAKISDNVIFFLKYITYSKTDVRLFKAQFFPSSLSKKLQGDSFPGLLMV